MWKIITTEKASLQATDNGILKSEPVCENINKILEK